MYWDVFLGSRFAQATSSDNDLSSLAAYVEHQQHTLKVIATSSNSYIINILDIEQETVAAVTEEVSLQV